jgi:hypothetical protein
LFNRKGGWHEIFVVFSNSLTMADNPNKKKADGKRISHQPHEQAYQRKKKAAKKGAKKK